MTNQILVVGSVAFDSITTPFGKVDKTLGGSATYFSLASSLFAPTSIVGVVGSNFKDFNTFKKHKIDIAGLEKAKGKTFAWGGEYGFDLNTRTHKFLRLGVFKKFKPVIPPSRQNSPFVFLGNIHPKLQLSVLKQVKSASRRTRLVGLDTVDFWIQKNRADLLKVLKLVDVVVINDGEARELSKENNLIKASRVILKMMGGQKNDILIIKQGEHGLLLFHHSLSLRVHPKQSNKPRRLPRPSDAFRARNDTGIFNLPGYPLENVIDPTGAGDSFAGGLMGYLAKTNDLSPANLKKACAVASTVASFSVENFGTKRLQSIRLSDVNQRLAEYKKLINF